MAAPSLSRSSTRQPSPRSTGSDKVLIGLKGRSDIRGVLFKGSLLASMFVSLGVLIVLIGQVVLDGWSVLSTRIGHFMTSGLGSHPEISGIAQGLRGTFYLCVIVALVAFPVGIGAAIYLEEYASRNRLTRLIDINIRNLAGVPSVVYGILGLTIFVKGIGLSWLTGGSTPLAAGLTLSALVLPVVIITTAESLRAVPQAIKEGAYGVGATRWEVIKDHMFPYAAPGILTGTLLSIARAAGEAAPLILVGTTTGFLTHVPAWWDVTQVRERFTALPIIITTWARRPQEGFKVDAAAAAIVILILFVIMMNAAAIVIRNRFEKRREA
ncbi:MAG: phosphate ABC transporter permease PstA [Actinomycetia bacterium]|nr:phosphate ABC transporter permease PstA [Actinomycetes bacterium]